MNSGIRKLHFANNFATYHDDGSNALEDGRREGKWIESIYLQDDKIKVDESKYIHIECKNIY